jgi:hypothetical protein
MLPWLLATATLGHDEEKPRWHELLRVIVPIGAGVLLFAEGHRLLPAPRAAADTGTGGAAPAHLAAADLFWVCYKVAGLIATAMGVWFSGAQWLQGASWKDAAPMLPLLAFGLLLLFNDAPFRFAARGRVPR